MSILNFMPYLLVENFSQGLDTRRLTLTTKAGALLRCKNAHITRGGEIEKRKDFVTFADLIPGTFGLHAVAGNLYVFGSGASPTMPTNVNYQQLIHPSGSAMVKIIKTESFNGKIYAIAQYLDGSIYHFYNGVRVSAWDSIYEAVADKAGVAASLSREIDEEEPFVSTSLGDTLTITAATAGVPFDITKSTTNGGTDPTQDIVLVNTVPNVTGNAEVLSTGSFQVSGGSSGVGNQVTSVSVNGVTITNAAIAWTTSNANTAALIAANINTYVSSPNYSAISQGQAVIISAAPGTGAGPNGFTVVPVPGGNVVTSGVTNMSGGVAFVASVAEVWTAQISGVFETADTYTINLMVPSIQYSSSFTVSGSASGMGRTAKTHKTKMYSTTRSLIYFSKINDPTVWGGDDEGQGFINISNEDAGSEDLSALGVYQGKLAIFSRRSIQIWDMDADPSKNIQSQILGNIGTFAPNSVVNFGDQDVFFLSDSGVRSLRARDASNNASVSDVGTNIDTLISEDSLAVSESDRNDAVAIIEPNDGRYWLALGEKIYVFSFFPTPGISAWSTYEPGFRTEFFAYSGGRVYSRSGDTIYVYGGINGNTYGQYEVDIELPYLDGGVPATIKSIKGVDMACEGIWDIKLGCDITNPDAKDVIATTDGSTFMQQRIDASGQGTHFGIRLTNNTDKYSRVGNFVLHFDKNDAD